MKKSLIIIIVGSLFFFNIVPIINLINPDMMEYTLFLDLLITNTIYVTFSSCYFNYKFGKKYWIALVLPAIFIPTMFIFYNTSTLIYLIMYVVVSFIGAVIGSKVKKQQ